MENVFCTIDITFTEWVVSLPACSYFGGNNVEESQVCCKRNKSDNVGDTMCYAKHHSCFFPLISSHFMLPHLIHVVGAHREEDEAVEDVDDEAGAQEGKAQVRRVALEVSSNS